MNPRSSIHPLIVFD